jgi:heat shock protein HslJ
MGVSKRRRRGAVLLAAVPAGGLLSLSVGTTTHVAVAQSAPPLAGTFWPATAYNDKGTVVPVLPGTQLTALFGDAIVSGETGCNRYQGSYTTEDSTIAIGPLITTLRACLSQDAAAQEQAFLADLSSSASYDVADDRLTLPDASGATLLVLLQQATTLSGAAWRVQAYNNGHGPWLASSSPARRAATAVRGRTRPTAWRSKWPARHDAPGLPLGGAGDPGAGVPGRPQRIQPLRAAG